MKKILLYIAALWMGSILTSCTNTGEVDIDKGIALRIEIDAIGTSVDAGTRALAATVEGEDNVAELHLLFFEYAATGDGEFVKDYYIKDPAVSLPIELTIGTGEGRNLSHSKDYSILALANMENCIDEQFISGLTGKSENWAKEQLLSLPSGFSQKSLPMSGVTAKMSDQNTINLTLTRAVCRFDVQNSINDRYDLVSASIYNAAKKASIWSSYDLGQNQTYTDGEFYGRADNDGSDIIGGLYAFENFQGDPQQNAHKTTALIIGLKAGVGAPIGTAGNIYYYRVNVHPDDSGQNLKRNHIYKLTVRGVLKEGATSEKDAIADGLDCVINNWDLDEDGMVVTDGQNTMAIPSKYIKFGPDAETRVFEIYTIGEGTLSMTDEELPNGLMAKLDGNSLTVSAEALVGDVERSGKFTLRFGGLRGTVEVVQSPANDKFLKLSRNSLPKFESTGRGGISDGELVAVSASGPWTATIYNADATNMGNSGFSFSGNSLDTEWKTGDGESFNVYTTGDNQGNDLRMAFIIVSLDSDPKYKQALILTQDTKSKIRCYPDTELPFDPMGVPINDDTNNYYVIEVSPGETINKTLRKWDAEIIGDNIFTGYYKIDIIEGTSQVRLSANGSIPAIPGANLTGKDISGISLRIKLMDATDPTPGVDYVDIPITQSPIELNISKIKGSGIVPVTGSKSGYLYQDYVEYMVTLHPKLKWTAEITSQSFGKEKAGADEQWKVQEGFFIDKDKKALKNTTALSPVSTETENTIRVGFDKIYYPFINREPVVEVTVRIEGAGTALEKTFSVSQEKLLPRPVKIQSYYTGYGGLGNANNPNYVYYTGEYNVYLMSSHLFSTTGTSMVKVANPGISKATNYINVLAGGLGVIETGVTYVQLNTEHEINPAHFVNIEKWWEADDHHLLVTSQESNSALSTERIYTKLLNKRDYKGDNDNPRYAYVCEKSIADEKRAMLFMIKDGPATRGNQIGAMQFHGDDINTGLIQWPKHAIPILQCGNNANPTHMSIVIDPVLNYIFFGEMQNFESNTATGLINSPNATVWTAKGKFLANLTAYVVNASQYGSHFTDMFIQLEESDLKYNKETEEERAARYENVKNYWKNNTSENW